MTRLKLVSWLEISIMFNVTDINVLSHVPCIKLYFADVDGANETKCGNQMAICWFHSIYVHEVCMWNMVAQFCGLSLLAINSQYFLLKSMQ